MDKYILPSGAASIECDSHPTYIHAGFDASMPMSNKKVRAALFESLKQNLIMANKLAEPRDALSL